MPTEREEKEEQAFFAQKLKEQEKENKMAKEHETETKDKDSVSGYSGSKHEGKKIERPEGASDKAVISDSGVTEPTVEFGGDGITPLDEFNEKMEPLRKEQAEKDKALREKTAEDAGVIKLATPKGKHANKV